MVIASFMVAGVAVVIALASVRYTRAQAVEARKATAIEQDRWHKPGTGSQLTQEQVSEVIWGRTGLGRGWRRRSGTGAHMGRLRC